MLHLDESTHLYEKLLELAPQAVDKIQQMLSKKEDNKQQQNQESKPHNQQHSEKQDFDI